MFNSKGRVATGAAADGKGPSVALRPSVLAEGISISGDIYGEGELLIEGRLDGSVRCRALTIGETGSVKGRIVADIVLVKGTIEGEVEADQVTLARTARVIGDVCHTVLAVDAGAVVDGRYSRLEGGAGARTLLSARQDAKAPSSKGPPPARGRGGQGVDAVALEVSAGAVLSGDGEGQAGPAKPLH